MLLLFSLGLLLLFWFERTKKESTQNGTTIDRRTLVVVQHVHGFALKNLIRHLYLAVAWALALALNRHFVRVMCSLKKKIMINVN